ncbi:MAG: acyl-CoA thioesterase [Lachnospiraceae bacterium]|nr:acyl-CoA thioesterase [Lachnospiraceae bacterium]
MMAYEHQAQYYETDQMGIIHHSNYIRWMESARIWWMQQAGIDYGKMEEDGIVSPVVSVSCQYKSMVHFGDTVLIAIKIEKYNGVKLSLSYRVTDKESGGLRMTGSSEHCFMDRGGHLVSLKKKYPDYDEAFVRELRA